MTDRLHFRLFSVAGAVCLSTLFILYVVAMNRERDRRVVPFEVDGQTLSEDEALTAEQLAAAPARTGADGRSNVVVVLLGGVRPDKLSDDTLPELRAWSEGARSYTDARSVASWQTPARASVLTGVHPSEHGVHRSQAGRLEKLDAGYTLFSESFQDAGYRTAAVLAETRHHHVKTGLQAGFDVLLDRDLEDGNPPLDYARADRVTAMAEQVVDAWEDQPFLLVAEYLDGCTPWVPWDHTTGASAMYRIVPSALHFPGEARYLWRATVSAVMQGTRKVKSAERQTWNIAYTADLLQLDHALAGLLERVGELERDTWVFVVGTHGEPMGEHGVVGHGWDVYSESLEVPWFVVGPGVEPGLDPTPVELTDLHDQVLAAAGLGAWPEPVEDRMRVAETFYGPSREIRLAHGRSFKRVKRSFLVGNQELMLDSKGGVWPFRDGRQDRVASGPWTEGLEARARAWIAEAEGTAPSEDPEEPPAIDPEAP